MANENKTPVRLKSRWTRLATPRELGWPQFYNQKKKNWEEEKTTFFLILE